MLYPIQVILYSGVMLLIYVLLLRDKPFHSFNRAYLLLAAIVPALIPLIKLPELLRPQTESVAFSGILPELTITAIPAQGNAVPPVVAALGIYLLVAVAMLVARLWSYAKMKLVMARSPKEEHAGYTILRNTAHGPGSWGRYIFLPGSDADETIIRHELVHVGLHHTLDMVYITLLQAIMWPNLFIHLIRKELVQVHEFQADAAVDMDATAYSQLLLSTVFGTQHFQLAHSFINHPIKRRIMMLHKNRKAGKGRLLFTSALATAILAGIITVQSCERAQDKVKPLETSEYSKLTQMPQFNGDIVQFLSNTVQYPQEAKDKGIEGRVMIEFVIDENGKVVNPSVKSKDADPLLAKAALDAMAQMPDWTPGEVNGKKVAVRYVLPFSFKMDQDAMSVEQFKKLPEPLQFRIYGELYEAVLGNKGMPRIKEDLGRIQESLAENKDLIHQQIAEMQKDPEKYQRELEHIKEAHGLVEEYNKRKN